MISQHELALGADTKDRGPGTGKFPRCKQTGKNIRVKLFHFSSAVRLYRNKLFFISLLSVFYNSELSINSYFSNKVNGKVLSFV